MTTNPKANWRVPGAIVQFTEAAVIPIPNIIIFQYNPETLSRSLQPFEDPDSNRAGKTPNQIAALKAVGAMVQPTDPTETVSVSLYLDASDPLNDGWPIAIPFGVQDRLSALEMLMYPAVNSVLGALVNSIANAIGGSDLKKIETKADIKNVPLTLFIWGPGRIVPVRLTSFSVEEQQWNQLLYVQRAKVSLGMRVLTDAEIEASGMKDSVSGKIASFCYKFTKGQKEVLALANLASDVESIASMIPT
jgi:hypothetical protein